VIEVSKRLSYWTAVHPSWKPNPEWPPEVGCVLYDHAEALVLFIASLRELAELDIERVLVAHGPPVLTGGNDAIAAALRAYG